MPVLGIVVGFIIGAVPLGWSGGVAGAFVGFIVALALRSRKQARERSASDWDELPGGLPPALARPADAVVMPPVADRLTAIERRLVALERLSGIDVVAPIAATAQAPIAQVTASRAADVPIVMSPTAPLPSAALRAQVASNAAAPLHTGDVPAPDSAADAVRLASAASLASSRNAGSGDAASAGFSVGSDGTLGPTPSRLAVRPTATAGGTVERPDVATAAAAAPSAPSEPPRAASNPVWAWFTGGNLLTRVGVIVLFFGVGFLLKYFAEFVTIPIELRLLGVAAVGAAIILLGVRLGRTRPGYGLSLEGAGSGILYLTTFAAFRLYDVLPSPVALAMLVGIAAFTVWRATRTDSQPLAALAIAGGFLAPFLVGRSTNSPALLFGYFAILNAAIFALAWVRAWRALNVLGFIFTFALGIFWGDRFYRPEHFATVEPFLVLFFGFFVTIAILYAKRGPLQHKAPVDALLVFGVPLVGFALQAGLVHDTRYGAAWSALAMAVVYGVLSAVLGRRTEPGLRLIARAFLVLAIIFATIAIPFAADPRWTSAWWALEAAAVYWIGCKQRQTLARAFAILLQIGAAGYFAISEFERGQYLFLNATYLGTTLIALAAFGTAFIADRYRPVISGLERSLVPIWMLWGLGWWYAGAILEIWQALPTREEPNAILAFAVGSVALALVLRRQLRWDRLFWVAAPLLPLMLVVGFEDWERMHTTLLAYGWMVWPLAWLVHWRVMHALEFAPGTSTATDAERAPNRDFLKHVHTASAIALVAWMSWEASEWVGREFAAGTVWLACAAALPAIAYLAVVTSARSAMWWPLRTHREAYALSAASAIAALLGVWFAIVNLLSPGDTAPLPFLPVLNPLDLTLVASLAVLFMWARNTAQVNEKTLYGWFGAAVFLFINALAFRTAHQWLDVPWRMAALLASKPLQAALTLLWTATALPLMLVANKRRIRPLWMVGVVLLAVVVGKLFLLDLGALSGLPRVVAFLGVGVLLLLIGYLAPLPPAVDRPPRT